ncbi:mitofilin [Carabus blaptoides fortunei]
MITFVIKFPHQTLSRNCRYGINRLNCNIRSYSNNPTKPICPPPKPKKDASTGTFYTISALTLIGAGTIAYAKYDPDFRKFVSDNVPYADGFFKFVFQEEQSFLDSIMASADKLKSSIVGSSKPEPRKRQAIKENESNYEPPRAVFPSLMKEEKEEKFTEIRVQKDLETVDTVSKIPPPTETVTAYNPKSISDLEMKIRDSAAIAVHAYTKAETALKDYNQDIEVIIESSVEKLDPSIWKSLKNKTDTKNEILKEAENNVEKATSDLEKFESVLRDPVFDAPESAKATAKRNIERVLADIQKAKEHYEVERSTADITEKYWKKVETARCHFIQELEILFPNFDINKRKLSLQASDLDLFILHAFASVLYYQKELKRVETLGQMKLKQALDAARKGDPNFSLVETAINEGIEREKRKLADDFQRKCLALRKASEKELRHRLKCQEQAHIDHLADVLSTREQELEREFNRKLDEQVAVEQAKYKMQMAGMIARMKGMKTAIIERVEADKIAHQSQVLWSACQALHRAVKTTVPGMVWKEQVKPLNAEIEAIKKAAAEGDELVDTVLSAIPQEALERGVYPEGAIRERFLKVERVARRLALVPEDGGRLPLYFLSFLQSMLLINAANPIPQAELADEKIDFSKLDTYDILQRARYWLDRGNYMQTLKYMNLLKGASRCVASDWIKETRILLETQQAAETLMAHAVAGGLLHL